MKTLIVTLHCCRCGETTVLANWQPFINALPAICGWILVLILLYFVIRYVIAPYMVNCHEQQIKKDNFEQELEWHFQTKLEKDFKGELENRIAELTKNLSEEKSNREKSLKEERLKAEYDFYKKIVETFYTKDEIPTE
jgi:flagellar biosynthesis/type III secretory pathway M-ring protein FliF/YscJ